MFLKNMINVLKNHDNCFVTSRPTETQLSRLRKIFNCDFTVRDTTTPELYGYVIEKEVNK